ncbi:hypothetical protein E3P99_03402 [Wallemia hederae]|uniref:PX domain-containing protein n=1 Tax=Wallemia hederae TaxID=1540922 RepID=A0A4T0FGN7_9BASI|nr:hypothetical protein E3P99_03402 [Wallemia hederae]
MTSIRSLSIDSHQIRTIPPPSHAVYQIRVVTNVSEYSVSKRYSDFAALDEQLRVLDGSLIAIPSKHLLRFRQSTNEEVVRERIAGFNAYLHHILASRNGVWRESKAFKAFINLDSTAKQFHWMERYTQLSDCLRALKGAAYKRDAGTRRELFAALARVRELQVQLEQSRDSISSNEFNKRHQKLLALVDQLDLIELMMKDGGVEKQQQQQQQRQQQPKLSFGRTSKAQETDETRPLDSHQLLSLQSTKMAAQDTQLEQISVRLQRQLEMGLAIHGEIAQHNELLDGLDSDLSSLDVKLGKADKMMSRLE